MKHAFIINSHTTFLTAIGTINFLKLNSESVILILIRHYENSYVHHTFKSCDLSELSEKCFKGVVDTCNNRNQVIDEVDSFINSDICENYVLYSPHYSLPLAQILYTSKFCVEGNYIQEGAYTFKGVFLNELDLWHKLRYFTLYHIVKRTKRIWGGGRYWYIKGALNKQTQIKSFAISDSFFKFLPSQNFIIKWPNVETGRKCEKDSRIFIFDGFVKNKLMEKEHYAEICERLIKKYARPMNYIKFHPAQPEEERYFLIDVFKKINKRYEVLDNGTPMELIICSEEKLSFAGFSSSVIYFAMEFGHDVIHREDWQMESKLYSEYRNKAGITSLS